MRDLFSLQHSIFEDVKKDDAAGMEQEFIKELFNHLCLEIEKGTDLSKYLTVSFNKKEEYVIQLKLPISSGIFNVNDEKLSEKRKNSLKCIAHWMNCLYQDMIHERTAGEEFPCQICPISPAPVSEGKCAGPTDMFQPFMRISGERIYFFSKD